MPVLSFEDYLEDFLDLHIGLMSESEIKEARASYAELIKPEKSAREIAKHEKALAKAKESRKLAKFYGGKALTGTAKQKKWAEEIRRKVLESSSLTDDQKIKLVTFSETTNSAKFWINNKDKSASAFNADIILSEVSEIKELYSKHYDTLARRSGNVYDKELARKEIYDALSSLTVSITFNFPNCSDFYDHFGALKSGMKFKC